MARQRRSPPCAWPGQRHRRPRRVASVTGRPGSDLRAMPMPMHEARAHGPGRCPHTEAVPTHRGGTHAQSWCPRPEPVPEQRRYPRTELVPNEDRGGTQTQSRYPNTEAVPKQRWYPNTEVVPKHRASTQAEGVPTARGGARGQSPCLHSKKLGQTHSRTWYPASQGTPPRG